MNRGESSGSASPVNQDEDITLYDEEDLSISLFNMTTGGDPDVPETDDAADQNLNQLPIDQSGATNQNRPVGGQVEPVPNQRAAEARRISLPFTPNNMTEIRRIIISIQQYAWVLSMFVETILIRINNGDIIVLDGGDVIAQKRALRENIFWRVCETTRNYLTHVVLDFNGTYVTVNELQLIAANVYHLFQLQNIDLLLKAQYRKIFERDAFATPPSNICRYLQSGRGRINFSEDRFDSLTQIHRDDLNALFTDLSNGSAGFLTIKVLYRQILHVYVATRSGDWNRDSASVMRRDGISRS